MNKLSHQSFQVYWHKSDIIIYIYFVSFFIKIILLSYFSGWILPEIQKAGLKKKKLYCTFIFNFTNFCFYLYYFHNLSLGLLFLPFSSLSIMLSSLIFSLLISRWVLLQSMNYLGSEFINLQTWEFLVTCVLINYTEVRKNHLCDNKSLILVETYFVI